MFTNQNNNTIYFESNFSNEIIFNYHSRPDLLFKQIYKHIIFASIKIM